MYIVASYIAYLTISLAVTIWVAKTLRSNGRPFLVVAFQGNQEVADSVNQLHVVGFYLINVGSVALELQTSGPVPTVGSAIELVCYKIGVVLVVLGLTHFLNLYLFSRLRNRGLADVRPPLPAVARFSVQPGA